ncbi:MAG: hypothetical protein OXC62_06505 [Aestuariivita sp.]|nr:hypothetical protein [Aestuariivita sp.]
MDTEEYFEGVFNILSDDFDVLVDGTIMQAKASESQKGDHTKAWPLKGQWHFFKLFVVS